jgi:hypothetical protein
LLHAGAGRETGKQSLEKLLHAISKATFFKKHLEEVEIESRKTPPAVDPLSDRMERQDIGILTRLRRDDSKEAGRLPVP